MKNIEAARKKAAAGERLSLEDALALYEDNDLLFLADCARRAKEKKSGRLFCTTAENMPCSSVIPDKT